MDATIIDLRYRMKDVLRAIDRGENVTVRYRGKAKATLTPISAAPGAADQDAPKTEAQPFFGMWRDREDLADPASWLRSIRRPRDVPGGTGARSARTRRKSK